MPGNKTSKAQLRASAKWAAKNKDKKKFISYKSKAKKFISEMASDDGRACFYIMKIVSERH